MTNIIKDIYIIIIVSNLLSKGNKIEICLYLKIKIPEYYAIKTFLLK